MINFCYNCTVIWAFFALPFFGIWMKTDLFQACGHAVFQICWHIEFNTFTASSFRIWNSSTVIPSPPLALFLVMVPKDHLTSHYRMSDSRWVITASWASGSLRSFLYSSVYACYLFISSASIRFTLFLSFTVPNFAWNVPLVSLIFLKKSLVFPILLFPLFPCIDLLGRFSFLSLFFGALHSDGYIFPCILCLSILFFSQLSVRPPQTTRLLFCISFSGDGFYHSCTMSPTPSIVLQILGLWDIVPWIYLSLPLYNKGFDLGHTWMV